MSVALEVADLAIVLLVVALGIGIAVVRWIWR
jgi:hypothetical protein